MGHRDTELIKNKTNMAEYMGSQEMEEKVVSGETGVMVLEDSKDTKLIIYVPINGTNWFLTIIVPRNGFMEPANESIFMGICITIGLLLLAGFFTIRFSSVIRRSLKGVTSRIELLANGDLKTLAEVIQTKDETQVLSVSLNNTINSII